jgi:hypothetical protein
MHCILVFKFLAEFGDDAIEITTIVADNMLNFGVSVFIGQNEKGEQQEKLLLDSILVV